MSLAAFHSEHVKGPGREGWETGLTYTQGSWRRQGVTPGARDLKTDSSSLLCEGNARFPKLQLIKTRQPTLPGDELRGLRLCHLWGVYSIQLAGTETPSGLRSRS